MHTDFPTIFESINRADDEDCKRQLHRAAINYAQIRTEWYFMDSRKRLEAGPGRTVAHNVFISACNILSRVTAHAKEGNAWRAKLGDDRKVIGDFACYVTYRLGVMMR